MNSMMMLDPARPRLPLRRPEDETGGGDPAPAPTPAGDPAPGAPGPAGDPAPKAADPAPAPSTADDPAKSDDAPWYDKREWSDPALKQHMVKAGYHKGTVEEALERALKGEVSATKRLGRDPSSLIDAPGEGQDVAEWLKANGSRLGVPEKPEGYDIKLPDDLPEGMPIDDALLGRFKEQAHAMGLPPAVVQANVEFYAKQMAEDFASSASKAAEAEAKMDAGLKEAWGADWKNNQQLAIRGFQALAAELKMEPAAAKLVAQKMEADMGDVALLKFFHGLASKLGDDTLAVPKGGDAPALQLADAQQRKEQIMAKHTGDLAKARSTGDRARHDALQKELKGLNRIIATYSD
ncbi:hypothetical protein [Oceaniglobus trochenteri]|uniref:hypothetical protein n=1 Tax=Oceaniglobus trochenteri TaxID=2763260 RepID=UPI001CFFAD4D|nr:hypothetical protein [Oceaniglobus trochenteri]